MKCLLRVILLMALAVPVAAQTKKPIVASDLMKIATTNYLRISPDGKKAVVVVNRKTVRNESEYYYTRHLWVADLATHQMTQLTFGDKNDQQPEWSPDGSKIAFVRTEGEKSQIWILPTTGGEAYAFTKAEFGATRPRWSPDGSSILYTSGVPGHAIEGDIPWPYTRPGRTRGDEPNWRVLKEDEKKKTTNSPDGNLAEVRAWLAKNASESNPRIVTRQNLQGELNLQPSKEFFHLFVKKMGEERPIQLTNGFQDFVGAEWSPDGKTIVCHSKSYTVEPDKERDTDLWTVDPQAKSARQLLTMPGFSISNPEYSPDGSKILFLATPITNRHATQNQLAVVSADGSRPTVLTQAFDRDVNGAKWSLDSKHIYFASESYGYIPLYRISSSGGQVERILGQDGGVNEFDLSGNTIVYAYTEVKNPWEIYVHDLASNKGEQLSKLNEDWVKERMISNPVSAEVKRPDGTRVQYWVMEPVGKKEGTKYPVILNIHGGPSVMWGPGVFSMWHEYQLEASWGYGIVYSNPRGSGGYGDKFKKANFKNWGPGPSADILASLDDAIAKNSWIDKDQLFVEGGSYAGYMVAWIVGHDQRFKAANAQRGVYELSTFMGEGNAWRLVPDHFGGYPWEKQTKALLDEESPLTYVNNIKTPLLIIHGDQDLRTGVTQSEMLYKSLKILNRPVEYVRYPKEGHELTRSGNPGRMMDHLLRVIEFFERYVKHPEPPPATVK